MTGTTCSHYASRVTVRKPGLRRVRQTMLLLDVAGVGRKPPSDKAVSSCDDDDAVKALGDTIAKLSKSQARDLHAYIKQVYQQ